MAFVSYPSFLLLSHKSQVVLSCCFHGCLHFFYGDNALKFSLVIYIFIHQHTFLISQLKKYGMARETRPVTSIEEPKAVSTVEIVQQRLGKNGSYEFQQGQVIYLSIYLSTYQQTDLASQLAIYLSITIGIFLILIVVICMIIILECSNISLRQMSQLPSKCYNVFHYLRAEVLVMHDNEKVARAGFLKKSFSNGMAF